MGYRNVVNDGSSSEPRLRLQQSLHSLAGLPRDSAEWTLDHKLEQIASAGFTGFDAECRTDQEADELANKLHDRALGFGLRIRASDADELLPSIEIAHRMRAEYVAVEVPGSLKASPDIADVIEEMYEVVNDSGFPLFIETQRGSVTQDLRRTVKVINRFKKIRFTGDFSQYATAGELDAAWSDDVWDHLRQIAKRCGHWRGRIAFGQQIQNDIGDGSGELAQQFKKLWTLGMSAWQKKAQPGDVLPFTCESSPAPIAIADLTGREISDRWEQSLIIKRLAQEAWADALLLQTPPEPPIEEAIPAPVEDTPVL